MQDQLLVAASALAMIISVHLAVKTWLKSRESEMEEIEEDPYQFGNLHPQDGASIFTSRFSSLAQILRPTEVSELNALRQQLHFAGYRRSEAPELYTAFRTTCLLIGIILIGVLFTFKTVDSGLIRLASLVLLIAFFAPKWWLKLKINQRQEAISLSLPPTLDLLVTCMEAGLNLEQAIDRVSREISLTDEELADELQVVVQELNAGLSMGASFKKLSQRVTSEDLRNLCNVIIQSVALGASLGRAMREYASSARRKRELKLEEDAGQVTARLTLPLTICLLPSAMIAMLTPAVVTIMKSLGGG